MTSKLKTLLFCILLSGCKASINSSTVLPSAQNPFIIESHTISEIDNVMSGHNIIPYDGVRGIELVSAIQDFRAGRIRYANINAGNHSSFPITDLAYIDGNSKKLFGSSVIINRKDAPVIRFGYYWDFRTSISAEVSETGPQLETNTVLYAFATSADSAYPHFVNFDDGWTVINKDGLEVVLIDGTGKNIKNLTFEEPATNFLKSEDELFVAHRSGNIDIFRIGEGLLQQEIYSYDCRNMVLLSFVKSHEILIIECSAGTQDRRIEAVAISDGAVHWTISGIDGNMARFFKNKNFFVLKKNSLFTIYDIDSGAFYSNIDVKHDNCDAVDLLAVEDQVGVVLLCGIKLVLDYIVGALSAEYVNNSTNLNAFILWKGIDNGLEYRIEIPGLTSNTPEKFVTMSSPKYCWMLFIMSTSQDNEVLLNQINLKNCN